MFYENTSLCNLSIYDQLEMYGSSISEAIPIIHSFCTDRMIDSSFHLLEASASFI